MVLLAQIVDEDFHSSIQNMFSIDKVTNEAIISFKDNFEGEESKKRENDKFGDGKIKYVRYQISA